MLKSFSNVIQAEVCLLLVIVVFGGFAGAQTLTGVVRNSTTNKPAAGDDVILLKLGQGMEEAGHTKTDRNGNFSFKVDDGQTPHLVRVIHQEVTYHRMAPPGTTSVEVQVYDVAKQIDGIAVVADIMHVQAAGNGHLDITREFGVQNSSKPPRTQMNEQNLQFYVPDGAKIVEDSGSATTENGNPLKSAPVAGQDKNSYSFIFPLRPGLTQFEVSYQLPYSGSANLDPKSIYPLEHFVVMLPKTMQFAPAAASAGFKLVDYPSEKDASVQVASNPPAGQNLAFKISGEGKLVESSDGNAAQSSGDGGEGAAPATGNSQADNRPGGGLGVPIDAPDPLQKYRWWILGSFAGALAIAGVYVASRQQAAAGARRHQAAGPTLEPEDAVAAIGQYQQYPHQQQTRATSALLEGIKEELFSLELERKQGQISQENYDKAKATLDAAIDLALKRAAKTNFVPPATKAG